MSGRRHFCTYFDQNYIPRALIMLESLHRHAPDALIHALCLNRECLTAMEKLKLPFVRLYSLDELERADPELAAVKNTRSLVEYYFTLTPCLPAFLLAQGEMDEITYLDADMMFFSSPEALFTEAGKAAVIITPHRFSACFGEKIAQLESYGLYNVSWLTFRNHGNGPACLAWYRQACLDWCYDRVEGDRFADQKYLDAFPRMYDDVHILRHPGAGVAPWNLHEARLCKGSSGTLIDGEILIFYHAHAFQHLGGPFYASGGMAYRMRHNKSQKKMIFAPYIKEYKKAVNRARQLTITLGRGGVRHGQGRGFRRWAERIGKESGRGSLLFHL